MQAQGAAAEAAQKAAADAIQCPTKKELAAVLVDARQNNAIKNIAKAAWEITVKGQRYTLSHRDSDFQKFYDLRAPMNQTPIEVHGRRASAGNVCNYSVLYSLPANRGSVRLSLPVFVTKK